MAVGISVFARLKLRIVRNGFRGKPAKVVLFCLGVFFGLVYGGGAAAMFAVSLAAGEPVLTSLIPPFAGSLLVVGWLLLPLVWFGVDDTLDPARFALLPLNKRTLLKGLLTGALIGVPAATTLLALSGLALGTFIAGGLLPGLVATVGVLLGLLLCVVVSRAFTTGFASFLRSRKTRDYAAIGLAVLAASIGPIQLALSAGASKIGKNRLEMWAEFLGWTPLGAPFVLGPEAMAGRWGSVAARLGITLVTLAVLLWWWYRSVESAMLGGATSSAANTTKPVGTPVARFYGRSRAPRTPYGAMVQRELRYWMRDTRRRASLITFAVVAIFLPMMMNFGIFGESDGPPQSPVFAAGMMAFVGSLAAVSLANQFGFDGTAYAAHLIAGIPGRLELRARVVAYSWFVVPLLVVLAAIIPLVSRDFARFPLLLGTLFASYGAGVACCLHISVLAPYALPETQNPFAINTGSGVAKSLLALVAWVGGLVLSLPIMLLALLGNVGTMLAVPAGLAYGLAAVYLGLLTAGDVLDRRQPELLSAVTPRS